jgi:hypothetical protein
MRSDKIRRKGRKIRRIKKERDSDINKRERERETGGDGSVEELARQRSSSVNKA